MAKQFNPGSLSLKPNISELNNFLFCEIELFLWRRFSPCVELFLCHYVIMLFIINRSSYYSPVYSVSRCWLQVADAAPAAHCCGLLGSTRRN